MKASITYSVTTEESAEHGYYSEHGWYMPGGWEYPLVDSEHHEDVLEQAKAGDFDLELGEAIREAESLGCTEVELTSDGLIVSCADAVQDFRNGEDTYYTLHVSGVSPGTAKRIAELFA